jgi:plasmid stability protein
MKTRPNIMKQLTVRVPEEIHRTLKIRAAEEGLPVAVIVEALIRQYLTWKNEGGGKSSLHDPAGPGVKVPALSPETLETWGKMLKDRPPDIDRIFPGLKKEKKGKANGW